MFVDQNDLTQLSRDFGIDQQLEFVKGIGGDKAGFPFIHIHNKYAKAVISIYAGQVLSYTPHWLENDVFFVSDEAFYQTGKAIKGGIPICWPWFGDDPEDLSRAAHGFVRDRMWSVLETTSTASGETKVVLGLEDSEETRSIWSYAFALTLTITVGETLQLELKTQNKGDQSFSITQALHTYFSVGDISSSSILGLDGVVYLDKTADLLPCLKQTGDVIINEEVDRVYMNAPVETLVVDDVLKRKIKISSKGSKSTVVWNPWREKSAQMADLQADDYLKFVCVETTNAAPDVVDIFPGESFSLTMNLETK